MCWNLTTITKLTILGRTWHTTERADSSSLLLARQSDKEGDLRGPHCRFWGTRGTSRIQIPPRHHDTSAGATPTTIAKLNCTILNFYIPYVNIASIYRAPVTRATLFDALLCFGGFFFLFLTFLGEIVWDFRWQERLCWSRSGEWRSLTRSRPATSPEPPARPKRPNPPSVLTTDDLFLDNFKVKFKKNT